jgi:hypothetical protein
MVSKASKLDLPGLMLAFDRVTLEMAEMSTMEMDTLLDKCKSLGAVKCTL